MRCVLVGVYFVVVMAMSVATSMADDAAIARKVAEKLRYQQEQKALQGFHITVKVEEGTVWMLGDVANTDQRDMALSAARRVKGVKLVVNDLDVAATEAPTAPPAPKVVKSPNNQFVGDKSAVRQAAAVSQVMPPRQSMTPRTLSGPVGAGVGQYQAPPRQRGPVHVAQLSSCGGSGCYGGAGAATAVDYGGYSSGGVVYEGGGGMSSGEVQMPGHAWPSYASYPNYGAVTYPQQYSPKAWPYIGPFYPYPQVPLGWRKVALEWDDGWWMLDFAAK